MPPTPVVTALDQHQDASAFRRVIPGRMDLRLGPDDGTSYQLSENRRSPGGLGGPVRPHERGR